MQRAGLLRATVAVTILTVAIVSVFAAVPVHADVGGDEGSSSFDCGTIGRAVVDHSVERRWSRTGLSAGYTTTQGHSVSPAYACPNAMFAPAMAMLAFSTAGLVAVSVLVLLALRPQTVRRFRHDSPAASRHMTST